MCGIAGFIDAAIARDQAGSVAGAMAASLRHRGPDAQAVWSDPVAPVWLAHARLSIIDLSAGGAQPMRSASGRYIVTYNGEIYNFRALKAELQGRGARFRSTSDTEVLMAAIEVYGFKDALQKLNGMFALAVWDAQQQTLQLARDRMGEKPLYYGRTASGAFVFASELKALRLHPGFSADIDRDALTLLLRHNYIPAPFTIYRGILKLPAGCHLTLPLAGRTAQPEPYWSLQDIVRAGRIAPAHARWQDAANELEALISDSVGMRMIADVPLGAFLSGGIDSSLVTALMQRQSATPVQTFSIGFDDDAFNEAPYARAVAAHLGTQHTEMFVSGREALDLVPKLAALYDEPFADSSAIPTVILCALTRQHVSVALSGDGGDELFGGYDRYAAGRRLWRGLGLIPLPLRRSLSSLLTGMSQGQTQSVARALARVAPRAFQADRLFKSADILAARDSQSMYRDLMSFWKDPGSIVLGGIEPPSLYTDALPAAVRAGTDAMMYLDALHYLPDDILVKVDRAAMAVSLETRIPLLDHRIVELAWRLPLSMKQRGNEGKWILRQVLDRYVPRALVDRPKRGFGVPLAQWLRGPLRGWADAMLDPARLAREGLLDAGAIQHKWQEHLGGRRNWHYYLWSILMFESWLECNRDTSATSAPEAIYEVA